MIKIYGSDMCPDLRDTDPAFDSIKGSGSIGISAVVTDDKRVLLDWEEIVK